MTLQDRIHHIDKIIIHRKKQNIFMEEDVIKSLNNFYNEYWKISYIRDKYKKHITCDELDYLMNKHFGTLVKIETLQDLPNK